MPQLLTSISTFETPTNNTGGTFSHPFSLNFRLSGPRCDLLSHLYSTHDNGARQPSDDVLTHCLKEMLTLPDQLPTYLIMDAIDECPDSSGIPSPRERVLELVKSLVEFRLPNLHICVRSRPEIDVRNVLEPLTSCRVSLHDQTGQKKRYHGLCEVGCLLGFRANHETVGSGG
jgi:hypothetical protein